MLWACVAAEDEPEALSLNPVRGRIQVDRKDGNEWTDERPFGKSTLLWYMMEVWVWERGW